jgi:sialic acid synthase SpsE
MLDSAKAVLILFLMRSIRLAMPSLAVGVSSLPVGVSSHVVSMASRITAATLGGAVTERSLTYKHWCGREFATSRYRAYKCG